VPRSKWGWAHDGIAAPFVERLATADKTLLIPSISLEELGAKTTCFQRLIGKL
jgi:hypothetical protein